MIIGFFYILMQSGNKITNTHLIHLQYPQPPCQWQWQLPKTPMPTCMPCKLQFTGYFYSQQLWQQNTTNRHETHPQQVKMVKPTPTPAHYNHIPPCHQRGSTFLSLPRRRQSLTPPPYAATTIPWHEMGHKGKILRVVFDHPHISSLLRPPINIGCPGMNG